MRFLLFFSCFSLPPIWPYFTASQKPIICTKICTFLIKPPEWLESHVYTCNNGLLESGCRKQKHEDITKSKHRDTQRHTYTHTHALTAIAACQCCCDGCPAVLKYQLQGKQMSAAMMNALNTDSTPSCGGMLGCQG